MYQNIQKGDVAHKRISAFTADFKNQYFARKPVLRTDWAGGAQHCIWQNMYQNWKMPDKSSRLAAAFVRHLMQFKRKTFFRLFFIAIPLWQSSLRQLFQLCLRSLDQCCKQLMRLRNKAQPIPTCCWSETLQKESTRTMLNLLTKSQQISSVLKPPNNYIVILSRFWRN